MPVPSYMPSIAQSPYAGLTAGKGAGGSWGDPAPPPSTPTMASAKPAPSYFPELLRRPQDPEAPAKVPDYIPQPVIRTKSDAGVVADAGKPTLKNNIPLAVGIIAITAIAFVMIRKATD